MKPSESLLPARPVPPAQNIFQRYGQGPLEEQEKATPAERFAPGGVRDDGRMIGPAESRELR